MGGATNLHWSVSDIPFSIILCLNWPLITSTTLLVMDCITSSRSNDGLLWQSIICGRSQGVPGLVDYIVQCVSTVSCDYKSCDCIRGYCAVGREQLSSSLTIDQYIPLPLNKSAAGYQGNKTHPL